MGDSRGMCSWDGIGERFTRFPFRPMGDRFTSHPNSFILFLPNDLHANPRVRTEFASIQQQLPKKEKKGKKQLKIRGLSASLPIQVLA
jgi:hypothetical protein